MKADTAIDLVDRVLRACGGGRMLVIGAAAAPVVRAFRRRAVDAVTGTFE